jgi:photosystem II stability/assembly factor-like uncharacterized protein
MKNSSLFFITFLLLQPKIFSQEGWYWQNPLPQGNTLYSSFFIDSDHGTAVGEFGTIIKTTNGGETWVSESSGTTNNLHNVFFTDANNGTVVGSEGTILRTTDGGTTWISQVSETTMLLWGVAFTDANNGVAVGELGTILRTTDSGQNWNSQSSGTSNLLTGVNFTSVNIGTIVGQEGLVLRTTDGGTSWEEQTSGTSNTLCSVFFTDTNNGTATGLLGTILRTTDGGTSWVSQSSGTTLNLYSVYFTSSDDGITSGDDGTILRTTNGGNNWVPQSSSTIDTLYGISFSDENNGRVLGTHGTILKTTDGGTSWLDQRVGTLNNLNSVSYSGLNYCTAVGYGGIILRTTNGGATWFSQSSGTTNDLFDLSFTSTNIGTIVGSEGTILRTTDGGTTWVPQSSGTANFLWRVSFSDANNGTAVGSEGIIIRTTNGGQNWNSQTSGVSKHLPGVSFTNVNNGTVVGSEGTILRTTDGGENWVPQTSGVSNLLISVFFTDANNGTIVGSGGTILRTTDGGENWVPQTSGTTNDLYDVSFIDADNGKIVGNAGTILNTSDGGANWTPQVRNTKNNLSGVSYTAVNNGTVVGTYGTILKFTDGAIQTNPILNWTGETEFEIDGVNPDQGNTSTTFSFRVNYSDADGDAPLGGFPLIHIKKGGVEITNSPFTMTEANIEPFITGRIYSFEINTFETGSDYSYYFEAYDANSNQASGDATVEQNGPIVNELPPLTNYFTPIWTNNPYSPMNIYVTASTKDGIDLVAGDEIGVFDGDNCVGSVLLTESFPPDGYISIIASTDDPTTIEADGFIPGHTITYKLWDGVMLEEITRVTPIYTLGDGTFSSLGTALVSLTGIYAITQDVVLSTGWNILSLMATPDDPNMLQLLDPLITADKLVKVQDETGNAVEQLPVIGWINNIGSWQSTEGYYLKVNGVTSLSITGTAITLPLNIPLSNGWNIISYPVPTLQNALTVLEALITANQLTKVQNEAGNAVEKLPVIGWLNNIGDFESGEGYYLKVNTNTFLTLDEPIAAPSPGFAITDNKRKQTDNNLYKPTANHFQPVYNSPYLPMNIYIMGADLEGGGSLGAGDEIGIFDGSYCVGAIVLTGPINPVVSPIASTDDPGEPGVDGFTTGHTISYKFWLSSISTEITDYTPNYSVGDGTFASQGTAVLSFTHILPVELTSFTAEINKNEVNLKWQTVTEVNNYGFEVERKTEDTWQKLGFVQGNGNSNSQKEYSYSDNNLVGGSKFQYRLKQIDNDGKFEYSEIVEVEVIPTKFALYQNYPNPFNSRTTFRYSIPNETKIIIKVYDILGKEIESFVNEERPIGTYELNWNAANLPSGIYFYMLQAGSFVDTRKMILLK